MNPPSDKLYLSALAAAEPTPTSAVASHPATSRYSMTPSERDYLKRRILECVEGAYQVRGRGPEPKITVGFLFDWFDTNAGWGPLLSPKEMPTHLRSYQKATLRLQVRSIAEQLRRAGRLGSSIGLSHAGREARCYEPGQVKR
jgi:hypothetical protein